MFQHTQVSHRFSVSQSKVLNRTALSRHKYRNWQRNFPFLYIFCTQNFLLSLPFLLLFFLNQQTHNNYFLYRITHAFSLINNLQWNETSTYVVNQMVCAYSIEIFVFVWCIFCLRCRPVCTTLRTSCLPSSVISGDEWKYVRVPILLLNFMFEWRASL